MHDSLSATAAESPDPDRDISLRRRLEGSVLLAEDTADTRAMIATALESAGAAVSVVTNGREAVEAASKQVYDLVLMDIRMPLMDGRAAMTELRACGYLAPIIALTASVGKDGHQRLLDDGFDDLWPKPISLERIIERASDYMRSPGGDDQDKCCQKDEPVRARVAEARLASVRAEFARGLPRRLQVLQSAVDSGDTLAAREVLHQLAGTAGMMDFMLLSVEAGRALQEVKRSNRLDANVVLRPLQTLVEDIAKNNGGRDALAPPQV